MADDARPPRPDLTGGLPAGLDPAETGFFQLLRLLETDAQRFGQAGGPEHEPVRLGQNLRLGFATRDVERMTGDGPPRVDVNVLGLLGPEGPMPLHLTRWVMARLSNRWFAGDHAGASSDTAFLDFCNVLQHRMIALYWRAWAETRPEVQIAHGTGGRTGALMRCLAGLGLPGVTADGPTGDRMALRHGTSLAGQVRGVERLTRFLSDVIGAPVGLREFVGVWTDIPARLQTRLGLAHAGLGTGAVVGARSFSRHARVEIVVGPVDRARYEAIMADGAAQDALRRATLFALGHGIDADLRLVLAADEVPAAQLGAARLGRTAWLGPRARGDADDLRLPRITAPRRREAA
ncbi:type VI secretion system baseplate subunit TssG [Rhodovulum euryhalinum]|uniref:Type VI secretion system protein ImpH n=1 Tax=Rhodovulum euryhalinum TaxID=35805 RepID=A0A4R2KIX9_9RHOB|nr:type VI secretion system baseplate subunit TssG [Rhodovulum euryhalinum]TCO70529.1 type VI secretion system protein ImpH [Rhodovulum euryhalinum]